MLWQGNSQLQKHQAARVSRRIAVEQRRYATGMADTQADSVKLATTRDAGERVHDGGIARGVTRGERGAQFPGRRITMGAPNHCEGRRKVLAMSQVFSSIQYICSRRTSGSNMWGAKLASCPGRHPTSLHPWV